MQLRAASCAHCVADKRENEGWLKDYVLCSCKISPWDPESRELRAECYIRMGDLQKAIQDLTPTTRLRNDNRAAFLKLSMLHYSLGEHHESLRSVGMS